MIAFNSFSKSDAPPSNLKCEFMSCDVKGRISDANGICSTDTVSKVSCKIAKEMCEKKKIPLRKMKNVSLLPSMVSGNRSPF